MFWLRFAVAWLAVMGGLLVVVPAQAEEVPPYTIDWDGLAATMFEDHWLLTRRDTARVRISNPGNLDPNLAPLTWELQVSSTPMRAAGPAPWRTIAKGVPTGWRRVAMTSGHFTCVRIRSTAPYGVSPWGTHSCLGRGFDDSQLRSQRGVRTVRDGRYVDGKAAVLNGRARLLLRRVPAGSTIAPAVSLPAKGRCGYPQVGFLGHRKRWAGGLWIPDGRVRFSAWNRQQGGTVVLEAAAADYARKCRVGGLGILAPWAKDLLTDRTLDW